MKTQIVVVGGGAGGLELVRRLGRKDFDIILVERNHTHVWKPLLHEVAAVQRSRGLALCQRWDAFARISASAM